MNPKHRPAFTIVELMVVVTIIAVLLALLMPALDKAIYQAELAKCGANLRSTTTGTQVYAMTYKRNYPRRATGAADNFYRVELIVNRSGSYTSDFRPGLRKYMSMNASLNDPLTRPVDFEKDFTASGSSYSSALLWFGYRYKSATAGIAADKSMYRMGDRWSYTDTQGFKQRFSVLTSDLATLNTDWLAASHPDREGFLYSEYAQNMDHTMSGQPIVDGELASAYAAGGAERTMSRWAGWAWRPSPVVLDMNWGYEDGSVLRIANMTVDGRDKRVTHIALYFDSTKPENQIFLPAEGQ